MSSSQGSWNSLPNEIKLEIIKKLDNNSRLAVRTFSLIDRQLVDSVPYRIVDRVYLRHHHEKYAIEIFENTSNDRSLLIFDDFHKYQKKLTEMIENIDCINLLAVGTIVNTTILNRTSNQLKLTKNGSLLKVRELKFWSYNEHAPDILRQIDPRYLKQLDLGQNDVHEGIFDTPQVKQAYYLRVSEDNMTDEQLLKMINPEITLEKTKNITTAGINEFIKKCLLNLDDKAISFRIEFAEAKPDVERVFQDIEIKEIISESSEISNSDYGVVILSSNSNESQLEVEYSQFYIEATTIRKDQQLERHQDPNPEVGSRPSFFKSIECLNVSPGRLTITEKDAAPVTYVFDSDDDLQKKFTEETNKLDYIKHLVVNNKSCNWNLCLFKKQLTVGKLYQNKLNSDFLHKLEPIHLKEIEAYTDNDEDDEIYDMPQMIHAQKIEIKNCRIKDHQLLNMNAVQIMLGSHYHKNLTASGVNKFLKKILNNLNLHNYIFSLNYHRDENGSMEHLEGLDIISEEQDGCETYRIFNSPFPEFKLSLVAEYESIRGHRITVKNE